METVIFCNFDFMKGSFARKIANLFAFLPA